MLAIGMLLIWGGYDLSFFGWCLFRDYNVTLGQLSSPLHPYAGAWPPTKILAGQTWPGGGSGPGALGNLGGLIGQGARQAAASTVTNRNLK